MAERRITEELLRDTPQDRLQGVVLDSVYSKVSADLDNQYEIVTNLPKTRGAIYITWYLEAEVNNGGFNQFFWNSMGMFAYEAVEAYKLLGAPEYAELVQKAIDIYGKERAKLREFKLRGTMEAFTESYKHTQLNTLDDPFFELEKVQDPDGIRNRYIRDHMTEFVDD